MAGPWEKYQKQPVTSDGPWTKYQSKPQQVTPDLSPFDQAAAVVGQYKKTQFGSPQNLLETANDTMGQISKFGADAFRAQNPEVLPIVREPIAAAMEYAPDLASMAIPGSGAAKISKNAASPKPLARKMLSSVLGPSEEAIAARFKRPTAIKAAVKRPYVNLAEDLASTTNKLSEEVRALDDQAWGTLLKLKSEPQSQIIKILSNAKKEFIGSGGAKVGDADKKAVRQIDAYIQRVKLLKQKGATPGTDQMLDQGQIRELIQSIRNDTQFNLPETDPVNRAVQIAQGKIDEYLKTGNPDYEKVMKPLAEKTQLLKETARAFNLKNDRGSFIPSDTTAGKFPQFLDEKKTYSRALLRKLKDATGKDFVQAAQDYKNAAQFAEGATSPNGSRRVNVFKGIGRAAGTAIGAGAGFAFGPVPGGAGSVAGNLLGDAIGGVGGAYIDKQGGAVAAKLIDMLSKNPNSAVARLLTNQVGRQNPRINASPLMALIYQIANEDR